MDYGIIISQMPARLFANCNVLYMLYYKTDHIKN